MRKLKFTFHRVAPNQIYLSYVLLILECSAVVWDNCTIQDSNTPEKLQNEAARIVTGLTRSVALANLYRECGCITLNTRRKEQKLAFMYKAVNDLTPDYISDPIPHFDRDTTSYPLRNNNTLKFHLPEPNFHGSPVSLHPSLYGTRLTKRFVPSVAYHVSKVN